GPMPSPGSSTTLLTVELLSRQGEHEVDERRDALIRQRALVAALEARDHRLLAHGVAQRDPGRLLVLVELPHELEPPVDRDDDRLVDRIDRLAGLCERHVRHAVTPSSSSSASASGSISTTAPVASASFGVFRPVPVTSTTTRSSGPSLPC